MNVNGMSFWEYGQARLMGRLVRRRIEIINMLKKLALNYLKIGTIFQINLNKNNFKPTIEQLYRQYTLRKISEISQRDDVITNLSIAQQDRPVYTDNPFIPLNDIITEQHQLFGREREITRVFETLNSGSSVALIGEKKLASLLYFRLFTNKHQIDC